MRQILTKAEAMVAVYTSAEKENLKASGPEVHMIPGRDDANVCWTLLEGKGQTLIAALFLVYRSSSGEIKTMELLRWYGLRLLKVFEKGGQFFFKVAGPGLECRELKVCLADTGLEPQNKAAKAVMYH